MGFHFDLGHFIGPWGPLALNGHLIVDNGRVVIRRQRHGCDRSHEIAQFRAHFQLGVASETPQNRVDQTLGNVPLQCLVGQGKVVVGMVVGQDIPGKMPCNDQNASYKGVSCLKGAHFQIIFQYTRHKRVIVHFGVRH